MRSDLIVFKSLPPDTLSLNKNNNYNCNFLTLGINNPEEFKKIMLRNAKKLEWPLVVLLGKAVMQ